MILIAFCSCCLLWQFNAAPKAIHYWVCSRLNSTKLHLECVTHGIKQITLDCNSIFFLCLEDRKLNMSFPLLMYLKEDSFCTLMQWACTYRVISKLVPVPDSSFSLALYRYIQIQILRSPMSFGFLVFLCWSILSFYSQ